MSAFKEWLERNQPMLCAVGSDKMWPGVVEGMELAWDAACDACARAQQPMLRDMVSRGHARDACYALKTSFPAQGNQS